MASPKVAKAISTSVYSLWLRVADLVSWLTSTVVSLVRRIRSGKIVSQHYNELIKIVEHKQREIHNQTLEGNRPGIGFDKEIFRHYLLEGERQARGFTLALLIVVFLCIIWVRFG